MRTEDILFLQQGGVGMAAYDFFLFRPETAAVTVVTIGLQGEQSVDETVHRRVGHGESHGDVGAFHRMRRCGIGQRMEHRLEQGFVAKYDGRVLFRFREGRVQPLGNIACLRILRSRGDELDARRVLEVVEACFFQGVGELFQVLADEGPGLETAFLADVHHVIVPVKKGLSAFLQVTEQSFFHIVEHVEAHKDIRHVRRDAVGAFGKMLRHVLIQRPFVQHSFFFQPCVERGIDVVHPVPQGEELLFQPAVAFDGKVFEKMFQGLFLAGCQEVTVVQFFDGLYVAEQFMRIGQMLIDVVEVGQHDFAPTVKAVERFRVGHERGIDTVELAHREYVVATGEVRQRIEQFADGTVTRCPYRPSGHGSQLLVHEKSGAFVGEYHRNVAQVGAETVYEVLGDKSDECFHKKQAD